MRRWMWVISFWALCACNETASPIDHGVPNDLSVGATKLAELSSLTTCIAVDGSGVYLTGDDSADAGGGTAVFKIPLAGGSPVRLAGGADSPGCVVVGTSYAYFTSGDKIMKVPLAGGAAQVVIDHQSFLTSLVVHGDTLYWISDTNGSPDGFSGMNSVLKVGTGGSGLAVVDAQVASAPGGLAVDGTNVYYSDHAGVWARPLANPTATRVSYGRSDLSIHSNAFDISDTYLAMVEATAIGMGDVALYRLDGMARVVIANQLATRLVVDSSGVYATQSNQLVRFHLDGSGTDVIADGSARAIAVDATTVYFADGLEVMKIAK